MTRVCRAGGRVLAVVFLLAGLTTGADSAEAVEVRDAATGILTAVPAAAGLGLMGAGLGEPDRGIWGAGIGLAVLGPLAGHLVAARYTPSLVLLAVKGTGLGLMTAAAGREDFLRSSRPTDPEFWVGTALLSLAAGAEIYLGADDLTSGRGWWVAPRRIPGGGR